MLTKWSALAGMVERDRSNDRASDRPDARPLDDGEGARDVSLCAARRGGTSDEGPRPARRCRAGHDRRAGGRRRNCDLDEGHRLGRRDVRRVVARRASSPGSHGGGSAASPATSTEPSASLPSVPCCWFCRRGGHRMRGAERQHAAGRAWRPRSCRTPRSRPRSGPASLDFSTNVNPFGPAPGVRAAVAAVAAAGLEAYPDRRATALRHLLAEIWSISPRTILVGNGASELLWLVGLVSLRPGDDVLILGPAYAEYARIASLFGARPIALDAAESAGFRHDPSAVDRRARTGSGPGSRSCAIRRIRRARCCPPRR